MGGGVSAAPPAKSFDLPPILSFDDFVVESASYLARPREARLGRVSIGELSKREIKPVEFVIDGWMNAREQSFLAGESQSGKSFLALHVGMCVATGVEVLGRKTKQGLVIYQAGESGFGVTSLRIPAWIQHYGGGRDFSDVPFEIIPARVNLFRPDGNAEEFHQVVKAISDEWAGRAELRAVIVDTMSKCMSGANENDGRDVGRVLEHGERISRETGAHVCFVHHLPKNGTGMRGHGSLKGDTDTVAMVSAAPGGVRTVFFDKVKDGEAGGKASFELKQVKLGWRDDGETITSCVVLPVGEKEALKKAEESKGLNLDRDEPDVFRAFINARTKSGRFADAEMEEAGVAPGVVAVHYRDWREAYKAVGAAGSDGEPLSDDAIRKKWERNKNKLVRFGAIGWSRPWIWHTGKAVRGFPETSQGYDAGGDSCGQNPDDSWIDINEQI